MNSEVYVVGVGLTKFIKPRGQVEYSELGYEAGIKALLDAQINYDEVETGVACYCYGDSTCGQRVFYQFGMTQIPIYNVNNNCSTGSSGLHMARTMIRGGTADCVMVVGFEKMNPGSLQSAYNDRESPLVRSTEMMRQTKGIAKAPGAAQLFGNAGKEYMERYGATRKDLAEIARVNHAHSAKNPYSQFQDSYTLDQVLSSPTVHDPLTKLQCCPTSDGAGAAILCSEAFLNSHPHLRSQAIRIAGQSLKTDSPGLFDRSAISLVGWDMTASAARAALAESGQQPQNVDVCELHDCFSANELLTLDALGLSAPGKAHEMVRAGLITYGPRSKERCLINPSGGLISKGHPLGATGLAQCAELVWHLRGWANNRALQDGNGARTALQHNLGLGGAAVVTVYVRADGAAAAAVADVEIAKATRLGYNPATEARNVTTAQADAVRSKKARSEWAVGHDERARL